MTIDDMTPEEERAHMDEVNALFRESIEIIPDIEIGEVEDMRMVKLRPPADLDNIPMENILMDLSLNLESRQRQYPETKGLIVSELSLTIPIREIGFCPRRGYLVRMKYI